MRRIIPAVPALAVVFLAVPALATQSASAPASASADKARADKDKTKDKDKKAPRVFTNEDLEATGTRPSKVQDATAQGVEAYQPPQPLDEPAPPAAELASSPGLDHEEQVKQAEANIKAMEEQANGLLWQYLQSGDSNEILRLKSEQQALLEQIEQAKADLARLKGEAPAPGRPRPEPTPPPG